MRIAQCAPGVVLAAVLVAGCGGGAPDAGPTDRPTGPKPHPTESLAELTVPPGYDSTKGWQQSLNWVPDHTKSIPVTVDVATNSVGYMMASSDGYTTQVRDADTGTVRWTSKPWNEPTPMPDATGDEDAGEAAEIPDVRAMEQDGRSYVIAYAHGLAGKDDLHNGREVVNLAVYAADATGSAVAPLREVSVPVQDGAGTLALRDGGHGLLITWGDGMTNDTHAAAVDVATGKVTQYEDVASLMPQCDDFLCTGSSVAALTSRGPLVNLGSGGFGVPHSWFASDVAPKGTDTGLNLFGGANGDVAGAAGTYVVARWAAADDQGAVWSVHDTQTGAVRASVACSLPASESGQVSKGFDVALSPDGRYLVSGPVAFDLTRKRGYCLATDGDRKGVLLGSVSNAGTAYGAVDDGTGTFDSGEDPSVLVQCPLDTGDPSSLPAGTVFPYAPLAHSALFLTRDPAGDVRVSVIRAR